MIRSFFLLQISNFAKIKYIDNYLGWMIITTVGGLRLANSLM
jgi:hypothetical protein